MRGMKAWSMICAPSASPPSRYFIAKVINSPSVMYSLWLSTAW